MRCLHALSGLCVVLLLPSIAAAQWPEEESDDDGKTTVVKQAEEETNESEGEENDEQDEFTQEARFGLIGGPALTSLTADDEQFQDASDPLIRYSLGLHGEYTFYGGIGVALEWLFSRRGWETEGNIGPRNLDAAYEFSYFDFPLLLQLGVPIGESVVPRVVVGPHASVFIDGSRGTETAGPFIDEAGMDIDREDVHEVLFGLTAGLGLQFDLPDGAITFDLRYMHHFTDVFADPVDDDEDDNVRHRGALMMFGFLF